ncbi:hypothetical protein IU459_02355 [Nocardia amamiensis]|uniref:DUF6879 domain-containing protein n=1 Tax=Nocardia amamiensis TaxID=404578 RepID=A0ABS0CJF9_9NOCA|nr:DUF6879 family protein [Nocardia amamiensis]MBF6296381.1 hypothetical protein [Nocardia amamiensis]
MQLLTTEEQEELFRKCRERAFHLEVQDAYAVEDEAEALAKFLETGEFEYDPEWEHWDNLVREVTSSGRVIQRVRVVTEPHADYTRFLHATTVSNIESGEEIRWLPRHTVDPAELTADDWWVLDNDTVVFTAFRPDGNLAGFAVTTDSFIVRHCCAVRDYVWHLAIPHVEYRIKQ